MEFRLQRVLRVTTATAHAAPGDAHRYWLTRPVAFGFPTGDLRAEQLTDPDRVLQMGIEPVQIHVMSAISGVPWDEAWAGRQAGRCGSRDLPFIGRREFVRNTRASGRLKDLADIEALSDE